VQNSSIDGGVFISTGVRLRSGKYKKEAAMFICIVLLILLLPVAVLPLALKSFSQSELLDMGIDLENPQAHELQPTFPRRESNNLQSCQSCLSSGLPA
jgi:hypothetical protein